MGSLVNVTSTTRFLALLKLYRYLEKCGRTCYDDPAEDGDFDNGTCKWQDISRHDTLRA